MPEVAELRERPAGSVSGGQGKMVALGRALMLGTKLVILDEPFQGLAPVLAQRYAEALRRLRSQDRNAVGAVEPTSACRPAKLAPNPRPCFTLTGAGPLAREVLMGRRELSYGYGRIVSRGACKPSLAADHV